MKTLETLKFIGQIRSNKNRQRGFTLIELVIVLAVLGILAAIAIPQLTGLRAEAELSGNAANISSEVSNQFARDFAAGLDFTGDPPAITVAEGDSDIDWFDGGVCASITGADTDGDTIPSLDNNDGYTLVDQDGNQSGVDISVPAIDENGDTTQDTCAVQSNS